MTPPNLCATIIARESPCSQERCLDPSLIAFDPLYVVFSAPAILVMLYAVLRVKSAYDKYSRQPNTCGMTGVQIARHLLDRAGLSDVAVEVVSGEFSDYYDRGAKTLRLSPAVYQNPTVVSVAVAAHEVGHLVQQQGKRARLWLPAQVVSGVGAGAIFGYVLFITGFVVQFSGLIWLGISLFSVAVLIALVSLPAELDASGRAMQLLRSNDLLVEGDVAATKAVLNAAALAGLAGLLQEVGQLIYWILVSIGVSRSDE